MTSRLIPKTPQPVSFIQHQGSKGILDDYAVRKNVATKEGTIEQVPTADNHIVNKKYVDDEIAAIPAPDLSSLVPKVTTITINGNTQDLSANRTWNIAAGTPAGADTEIQFNDGGSFGAEAAFTYNKTTNQLKILDGSIDVDRYTTAYTGNDDLQGLRSRISVNSTDTGAQLISGTYNEVKDTSAHTVTNWSQNWRHEGLYNYVDKSLTTAGTVYDGEDSTFGILNVIRRQGTQTARSTDYFYLSQTGQYNQVTDYMNFRPSSAGEYTAVDNIGLRNEVAIVGVATDTTTVVRNAYGIWNRVTVSGTYAKADNIYGNYVYVSGNANTTNQYLFYGYQSTNAGTNRYGIYSYSVDNTALKNVIMGKIKLGTSTTAPTEYLETTENMSISADSKNMIFGAGKDAYIYYDGTNLIVNPKAVGSGIMSVLGTIKATGYQSSDGTAGATGTINLSSITTITVKNGLITAYS